MNLSTIMLIQSAMYNNMYTFKTMYRYNCFGRGGGVNLLEILTSTKKKDYSYSYVLLCKICGVQPPTPVRF